MTYYKNPAYHCWEAMVQRCENPNNPNYPRYGGRGIKIDSSIRSFSAFLACIGERPGPEYSIDRIDSNGDYAPNNIRWATSLEQNKNRKVFRGYKIIWWKKDKNCWSAQHGYRDSRKTKSFKTKEEAEAWLASIEDYK